MYTDPKKMAERIAENQRTVDTRGRARHAKPDCLNGYGDGPTHCTLVVGHAGPCNHLGAEVTP